MLPKFFEQIVSSSQKGASERTDVGLLLGLAAEFLASTGTTKEAVEKMIGEAGAVVEQSQTSVKSLLEK